ARRQGRRGRRGHRLDRVHPHAGRGVLVIAFGWWAPPTDGQAAGGELDWLVDAPWGGFAIVFLLATVVLVVSRTLMRRNTSARGRYAKPDFDLAVTKLEALPITPIAEAR